MSIFDAIGKATAKINKAVNKVGGAVIKGVSAVKAIEAIGPNAVRDISGVIKTAISVADNVERQIRETELGRRALAGIDKLSGNIVNGTINQSNMHIFQDPTLVKGLVNLKSPAFNGSIQSFADVADLYDSLDPGEEVLYIMQGSRTESGSGTWSYDSAGAEMASVTSNGLVPKYKFQFIVDIILAPELQGSVDKPVHNFTFLATEVDRPTIKYAMDEVNSYNFRFQVPKKMSFDPVKMILIDDNANDAMQLVMSVIRSVSPILNSFKTAADIEAGEGIRFTEQNAYLNKTNNGYLASVGPIQGADIWMGGGVSDTTSPISAIVVYQLYDKSGFVNVYEYVNPKIAEVQFDNLSMTDTANQVNQIQLSFVYDWVNIADSKSAVDFQSSIERPISKAMLVVGGSSSGSSEEPGATKFVGNQIPNPIGNSPLPNVSTPVGAHILDEVRRTNQSLGIPGAIPNQQLPNPPADWGAAASAENDTDWVTKLEQ